MRSLADPAVPLLIGGIATWRVLRQARKGRYRKPTSEPISHVRPIESPTRLYGRKLDG